MIPHAPARSHPQAKPHKCTGCQDNIHHQLMYCPLTKATTPHTTRCQIKVLFECGKTSFFKSKKKHFYFTKSFPNGIIGCVERGFYKKITRSPVSGDQVIRCCSDLMFPPKRDFILKKSLFLDGVHVQMINLFIKKFTHRLSALPQPYCSLSESPLSSLLSPCQPCSCPAA